MAFLRYFTTVRITGFVLLTILIIGIETGVTHTSSFNRHPAILSIGVLFDLVFVTTALFYWFVARPLRLANTRLLLVALLMLRIALFILPKTAFPSDKIWPALLILAEGTVIAMAALRAQTIIRTYRQLRLTTDIETALRDSLAVIVSQRAASAILSEGLTLYYVLMGWQLQSDVPIEARTLTTHRQSGQVALTIGLLVVAVIEGVVVHLLIAHWQPVVAIWVTALSAYGMLFFVADIVATVKRPSYLTTTTLALRLGIRWRAQIPRSLIANVSPIHEKLPRQSGRLNGAFLTAPNVLLTFNEPIVITGPYGLQKQVNQLTLFVDDQGDFRQVLKR